MVIIPSSSRCGIACLFCWICLFSSKSHFSYVSSLSFLFEAFNKFVYYCTELNSYHKHVFRSCGTPLSTLITRVTLTGVVSATTLPYYLSCFHIQCSPLISNLSGQWDFVQYMRCLIYEFSIIAQFATHTHRHNINVFEVWLHSTQRTLAMYIYKHQCLYVFFISLSIIYKCVI